MDESRDTYDALYVYAMGRGRETFILQYVVDAFAAQTPLEGEKPMRLVFALVGLYLHVEKGYNGRAVQDAHIQLGRQKREWPVLTRPASRGSITPADVMAVSAGAERDRAIDEWCRSVWSAFQHTRGTIIRLLRECAILPP